MPPSKPFFNKQKLFLQLGRRKRKARSESEVLAVDQEIRRHALALRSLVEFGMADNDPSTELDPPGLRSVRVLHGISTSPTWLL